jgi:hypothetical protein
MIRLIDDMRRNGKLDIGVLATMERMAVRNALLRGTSPDAAFDALRSERGGFAAFYGEVAAARAKDCMNAIEMQRFQISAMESLRDSIDEKVGQITEDVDVFARAPYREFAHKWIAKDVREAADFVERCAELERFSTNNASGPYAGLGKEAAISLRCAAPVRECIETEMAARDYLKQKAS